MGNIRNVIISGASKGIGYELAKLYASPGVNLGLIARDKSKLDACVEECITKGASVHTLLTDICDTANLEKWLIEFDNLHPIDLIIANAGVINVEPSIDSLESISTINRIFNVNYYGVLNTVNPVLNRMISRRNGQVAVMSSMSAYYGLPVAPAYAMSKASLLIYFQSLREVLAKSSVSLTIVCPGYIDTKMAEKLPISKPFMYSPEKAALIIKNGLIRKKRLLIFPLIMKWGINILQILPTTIADKILFRVCQHTK